jgi:hypothetical protein
MPCKVNAFGVIRLFYARFVFPGKGITGKLYRRLFLGIFDNYAKVTKPNVRFKFNSDIGYGVLTKV